MKNSIVLAIMILVAVSGCNKVPDPPVTPSGLSVPASTFTSLTLMWNPSPEATGYTLYQSDNISTGFSLIYQGPNTNYIVEGLTYATTYFFKVGAENEGGESALSPVVSESTKVPGGFIVSGSPRGSVDYPFHYLDIFLGKPRYQSTPNGLLIILSSGGEFSDLWTIYDQIDGMVLYYHPTESDYPSASGWLKSLDNTPTGILLTPFE